MRALVTILAVVSTIHFAGAQILLKEKVRPTPGEWSAEGVYLAYGLGALDYPGQRKVSQVRSPDSQKVVIFEGVGFYVQTNCLLYTSDAADE